MVIKKEYSSKGGFIMRINQNDTLIELSSYEATCVVGGIDSKVKKAFYAIGYVVGTIVRIISDSGSFIASTVKGWFC